MTVDPVAGTAYSGVEIVIEARPSFGDVYRTHHAQMVRLAYLLSGSHDTAQDVVQDAFVGLHRHWSRVDNVSAYLRRSVVNAVNSSHRRNARDRRRPQPLPQEAALDANEMFDALDTLVPRQRAAIVMRFHLDMSDAQIAEALGVKETTVASIVHRGLAELRKVIER